MFALRLIPPPKVKSGTTQAQIRRAGYLKFLQHERHTGSLNAGFGVVGVLRPFQNTKMFAGFVPLVVITIVILCVFAFAADTSAHFPKFVLHPSAHLHELRKAMGTSKLINSGTAFLFEVPGSNSPLVVQELQIGGTSSS